MAGSDPQCTLQSLQCPCPEPRISILSPKPCTAQVPKVLSYVAGRDRAARAAVRRQEKANHRKLMFWSRHLKA